MRKIGTQVNSTALRQFPVGFLIIADREIDLWKTISTTNAMVHNDRKAEIKNAKGGKWRLKLRRMAKEEIPLERLR